VVNFGLKTKNVWAQILTHPKCSYIVSWRKSIRHVVLGYNFWSRLLALLREEFRISKLTFHSDLRRRAASRLALPCPSSFFSVIQDRYNFISYHQSSRSLHSSTSSQSPLHDPMTKPTLDVALSPLLLPNPPYLEPYLPPSVSPFLDSFKRHLKNTLFYLAVIFLPPIATAPNLWLIFLNFGELPNIFYQANYTPPTPRRDSTLELSRVTRIGGVYGIRNYTVSQKIWGTHIMPHNSSKYGSISISFSLSYSWMNCRKRWY